MTLMDGDGDGLVALPSFLRDSGVMSQTWIQYSLSPGNQTTHQPATLLSLESEEHLTHSLKKPKKSRKGVTFFFPDEVVEKIIARIPFPSVFKALLLSKAWKDKFPREPSEGLSLLQREISSVSASWATYSPVFYNSKGLWGFDRVSSQWKFMLTFSHLPVPPDAYNWSTMGMFSGIPDCAGSLLLVTCEDGVDYGDRSDNMRLFVTNIITRSWRELNPRVVKGFCDAHDTGFFGGPTFCIMLAILLPGKSGDFDTYRVLLLDARDDQLLLITYDSSVDQWSAVTSCGSLGKDFQSSTVYLHGKLYLICRGPNFGGTWKLCVYNVDWDKTWMVTPLPLPICRRYGGDRCDILRCGQKTMVVTWHSYAADNSGPNGVGIYGLDLHSLQLAKVCMGPPLVMWEYFKEKKLYFPTTCASGVDFIYFVYECHNNWGNPIITFNVHNDEWDFLPHPIHDYKSITYQETPRLGSSFTPGLNPFAIV